jgi:hypothetical protein
LGPRGGKEVGSADAAWCAPPPCEDAAHADRSRTSAQRAEQDLQEIAVHRHAVSGVSFWGHFPWSPPPHMTPSIYTLHKLARADELGRRCWTTVCALARGAEEAPSPPSPVHNRPIHPGAPPMSGPVLRSNRATQGSCSPQERAHICRLSSPSGPACRLGGTRRTPWRPRSHDWGSHRGVRVGRRYPE